MANEYGPFDTERQALATRAAAALRAAFDANPGVGAGDPERLRLLTGACAAAGVELGDYDLRLLRWVAGWEDATCVQIAGMITRAYRAGLAARDEGAVTEWGVRYALPPGAPAEAGVDRGADRETAERMMTGTPHREKHADDTLVRREVGPWTVVPGEGEGDA